MVLQSELRQILLIIEASWSHSDISQLLRLLCESDKPDAENSDNTQHTQQTDTHAPGRIQTHNPSKRAAANPYLRQHGHWDRRALSMAN